MEIREFLPVDICDAVTLWNRCREYDSLIYMPMTADIFQSRFMEEKGYSSCYMLSARESGKLVAFLSGNIKKEYLKGENYGNTPGYLTMLLVDPEFRHAGLGKTLLGKFCDRLREDGKSELAITYRNLVMLQWQIPGHEAITHNNAPGVVVDSAGYSFFLSEGFVHQRTEDGLYLDLSSFVMPEKVAVKEKRLQEQGIVITHYDREKHQGLEALFDAVHGEVWRKTIQDNMKRDNPLPVIVAVDGVRIVGFAGPIDLEPSGRGWFNGIATHPAYERKGIATVMFCHLMQEFVHIGARFSTIFTDEGNPALVLYKDVGFQTGARFAVMEKNLK